MHAYCKIADAFYYLNDTIYNLTDDKILYDKGSLKTNIYKMNSEPRLMIPEDFHTTALHSNINALQNNIDQISKSISFIAEKYDLKNKNNREVLMISKILDVTPAYGNTTIIKEN